MNEDVTYDQDLAFSVIVGRRVRQLRKAADMTQAELGQALGVKPQQISKYENGTDNLSLENLAKAARLFRVTTDQLLGHDLGLHETGVAYEPAMPVSGKVMNRLIASLEDALQRARDLDASGGSGPKHV